MENENNTHNDPFLKEHYPDIGTPEPAKAPDPEVAPKQAVTESFAPTYIGNRRFDSPAELAQWASEQNQENQRYRAERESGSSQVIAKANQVKPSELIFSDPDAFYQVTKEDAKNEILSEIRKQETEKKVWNDFYNKYPDLKDAEIAPMVEYQFNKRKNDMGGLQADQALDTIGKEVRTLINKVRGKPEGGKELPSGGAVVASTANNTSQAKAPVQEETSSFADSLRRYQRRGK